MPKRRYIDLKHQLFPKVCYHYHGQLKLFSLRGIKIYIVKFIALISKTQYNRVKYPKIKQKLTAQSGLNTRWAFPWQPE